MSQPFNSKLTPMSFKDMINNLGARNQQAHKGDFGHVLLVGGNIAYVGAIRLAAEAALRVGSGLVSVATRHDHAVMMAMSRPELMCHAVESRQQLSRLAKRCDVVALGPGLGQDSWSLEMFEADLPCQLPCVLDADALNILSVMPRQQDNWVLTPHVGEAARLLDCTTDDIQYDRLAAVKQLQRQFGGVVVLKGSNSLVFDGGANVFVCNAGNPGMASGGMGDVLTGVIAGLIAQGMSLLDAAKLGVMVHAMAGDVAAAHGERGMFASDLMQPIRELMNDY